MNVIRRLSRNEASDLATSIALRLAEIADMKGWEWDLESAKPDPVNTESVGRTPRHWIALINYRRGDNILDGPGLIRVDLQSVSATWETSP
jgi:hypothetical protein